jgi:hypothetical protein
MVGIMEADDDDDVPLLFVVLDALENVKPSSLLLAPTALLAVIPGGGVVIGRDATLGCNGRAQALVAAAGLLPDVSAVLVSNTTNKQTKQQSSQRRRENSTVQSWKSIMTTESTQTTRACVL